MSGDVVVVVRRELQLGDQWTSIWQGSIEIAIFYLISRHSSLLVRVFEITSGSLPHTRTQQPSTDKYNGLILASKWISSVCILHNEHAVTQGVY